MTPKVEKEEKKRKPVGRAKMRKKYNTRILNPRNNNGTTMNAQFNQTTKKAKKQQHSSSHQTETQIAIIDPKLNTHFINPQKLQWRSIVPRELVSGNLPNPVYLRPKMLQKLHSYHFHILSHFQDTDRLRGRLKDEMSTKMDRRTEEPGDEQFCDMLYVLFTSRFEGVSYVEAQQYFEAFSRFRGIEGWKGGFMGIVKRAVPLGQLLNWNDAAKSAFGPRSNISEPFKHFLRVLDQDLAHFKALRRHNL
uniref:Uncharacterized protein n=1 Tax=Arcella intermedia TaxID=1963864 RepID=A0A6B2LEF4_9EUKA